MVKVFFGEGSSSANDSWGAAVLRKNNGRSFSKLIYDELQISVGKNQQIILDRWDDEEKYHSNWKQKPEVKNQRKRSRDERPAESKIRDKEEGTQYQTGVGMENPSVKKKRRTLKNIPKEQWFNCTEAGCNKSYVSKNGLKVHKNQHQSM